MYAEYSGRLVKALGARRMGRSTARLSARGRRSWSSGELIRWVLKPRCVAHTQVRRRCCGSVKGLHVYSSHKPLPYSARRYFRFTMAFRAFDRSPSSASQFRRTAFDTEPASPMQKYSKRLCAESIGAARVGCKRLLHFLEDLLDGLTTPGERGERRVIATCISPLFFGGPVADAVVLKLDSIENVL